MHDLGIVIHPRPDNFGKHVVLRHPHTATPLDTWSEPTKVSVVLPDGTMPVKVRGLSVSRWSEAPRTNSDWKCVPGQIPLEEPPFNAPKGLEAAAGAVVAEEDGSVWLAAPSNGFGGYKATFPKGRVEGGLSMQASAIREAFEEVGLQVQIEAFLIDSTRSKTYTRYYLARRVSGNPADMGWESQAVILAPADKLPEVLNNANDKPVLAALQKYLMQKTAGCTAAA